MFRGHLQNISETKDVSSYGTKATESLQKTDEVKDLEANVTDVKSNESQYEVIKSEQVLDSESNQDLTNTEEKKS